MDVLEPFHELIWNFVNFATTIWNSSIKNKYCSKFNKCVKIHLHLKYSSLSPHTNK